MLPCKSQEPQRVTQGVFYNLLVYLVVYLWCRKKVASSSTGVAWPQQEPSARKQAGGLLATQCWPEVLMFLVTDTSQVYFNAANSHERTAIAWPSGSALDLTGPSKHSLYRPNVSPILQELHYLRLFGSVCRFSSARRIRIMTRLRDHPIVE